jgi:hypothetical protein
LPMRFNNSLSVSLLGRLKIACSRVFGSLGIF